MKPIVPRFLAIIVCAFAGSAAATPCALLKLSPIEKRQGQSPCINRGLDEFFSGKSARGRPNFPPVGAGFPEEWRSEVPEVAKLQAEFYKLSGLYALAYTADFPSPILRVLIDIFASDVGHVIAKQVTRVRYFLASDDLSTKNAFGLYIEPNNAVAFHTSLSSRPYEEIAEVVAHELGHAALFSLVSAENFRLLALRQGGWPLQGSHNLYAEQFLMRYEGISTHSKTFPSAYAYANSHEWFAENFSHYLLAKLGRKSKIDKTMLSYFDNLLRR